MIGKRYNLQVKKFTRKELLSGGKGREVFDIINATYKDLYGYSQLSDRQINQLVDQYIKIADLNLVTAVEDWNTPEHKMVGFGITFPSFTSALRKTRDGRLLPFGWWPLLRTLKWHKRGHRWRATRVCCRSGSIWMPIFIESIVAIARCFQMRNEK